MFLPLSTDAPLYHRPYVTVGLIVTNVIVFIETSCGMYHSGWLLTYGNGLHPTEWVASAFLHFGAGHLIGNMFFLWVYGLIIEGKLGGLRFLALYLGMAAVDGAVSQSLMLGVHDGAQGAGGASGVIFAMMAIALVWAPKNEFNVLWICRGYMYMRSGFIQLSVLFFSVTYLFLNFASALFNNFEMSTAVLHLLGALVGLPCGLLFLHQGWVDCEGWDLFSVWQGKHIKGPYLPASQWKSSSNNPDDDGIPYQRDLAPHTTIKTLLESGKCSLAVDSYLKHREQLSRTDQVATSSYRQLIEWLRVHRKWNDLASVLEDYLRREPNDKFRAMLMLAQVYVGQLSRPKAAVRLLQEIRVDALSEKDRRYFHKIESQAQSQIDSGLIELAAN